MLLKHEFEKDPSQTFILSSVLRCLYICWGEVTGAASFCIQLNQFVLERRFLIIPQLKAGNATLQAGFRTNYGRFIREIPTRS